MKRVVALIAAALLALAAVIAVQSQEPPPGPVPAPGPGPGPHHMMRPGPTCPVHTLMPPPPQLFMHAREQLQLSEEQAEKLRATMETWMQTQRPLMDKAREANMQLRQAVLADSFDARKVQDLAAQAQKAETALIAAQIETWSQIRSILTTEQVRKLRELMAMAPGPRPGPGGPPPAPMPPMPEMPQMPAMPPGP